jgi:hypothetical protein
MVACVDAGHSARWAARVFGGSESTAVRLMAWRRMRGRIAPRPQSHARGRSGKVRRIEDRTFDSVVSAIGGGRSCLTPSCPAIAFPHSETGVRNTAIFRILPT